MYLASCLWHFANTQNVRRNYCGDGKVIVKEGIVNHFGKLVSKAERLIIEGIEDGEIETEPSITDRFLGALKIIFDEHGQKGNFTFKARVLRPMGHNAPERRFGADFCGILEIQFEDFRQTKGFLSQAKREGRGISVQKGFGGMTIAGLPYGEERVMLNEHIGKMLSITPDSFITVYSPKGFVVVPASSIKGLNKSGKLYAKPVDRFFKEYLMCFIGDPKLKAHDDESLERLRRETNARTAIMFQIHERG